VLENIGMMAGMEGVAVTEHMMVPKKDCGGSGRSATTDHDYSQQCQSPWKRI
jgi:hypothetical protein